ncbi:MAG: type IX secretion system membrane protein PorP/SprF [Saprospiraceae bacterium]
MKRIKTVDSRRWTVDGKALIGQLLTLALFFLPFTLRSQTTYNFSQINYNSLLINPAYTGNTGATSFQASYRGIIGAAGTGLPRRFNFTLHAPFKNNDRVGWGGMMEVYRIGQRTDLSLQPSFAYQIDLGDNQRLAIGAQTRFTYYGFDNNFQVIGGGDDPQDVFGSTIGVGVFYYKDRFFAGLGATNVAQLTFNEVDASNPAFLGENPIYLHGGFWFQPLELMKVKLAGLVNRTSFYIYPNPPGNIDLPTKLDIAANINAIFSDQYWFGFSLGRVTNDQAMSDYNYFNLSAVYTFNLARASYTYQAILDNQFSTALNTTHVIMLEFDIINGGEEKVIRYY